MTEHFVRAGQLYAAVAGGDLDSVRHRAQDILDHETGEGLPARSLRYVDELRSFTSLAARAPDVESAASAVARVGAACGACHTSLRTGPRYPEGTRGGPPPAEHDVAGRMRRHRWAADRLWEGLIGPSDEAWRAGAQVLRDAALYTDALTQDVAQYEQVTKLAWTVHEVGARADVMRDRHQRAELYGQLLGTCARCHALLWGGR
jgi:mono/diheme cytochrome c family protein